MSNIEKSTATLKLKAEDRFAFAEFYRDGYCLIIKTGSGTAEKVALDFFHVELLLEFIKTSFSDLYS